jgi:hypothetical protein
MQLGGRERLRDVVVGPYLEAAQPLVEPVRGGEEDERRVAELLQPAGEGEPARASRTEVDVEHREIRTEARHRRVELAPVGERLHVEVRTAEQQHQRLAQCRIVLDDEDPVPSGTRVPVPRPRAPVLHAPLRSPCAVVQAALAQAQRSTEVPREPADSRGGYEAALPNSGAAAPVRRSLSIPSGTPQRPVRRADHTPRRRTRGSARAVHVMRITPEDATP